MAIQTRRALLSLLNRLITVKINYLEIKRAQNSTSSEQKGANNRLSRRVRIQQDQKRTGSSQAN